MTEPTGRHRLHEEPDAAAPEEEPQMFTRRFGFELVERAVKSAAQAVLVTWGVGDGLLDAFALDWRLAAGVAAGSAIASALTSIASAPFGPDDSPSLV